LSFAPDCKKLASACDGVIQQWDIETGKEIRPMSGHRGGVYLLKFAANEKKLLTFGSGNQILEWDFAARMDSGRKFSVFPLRHVTESWTSFDLSPDGKVVAQSSVSFAPERKFDPIIRLRDTATGKERLALKGHTDRVNEIQFSPNGKLLASAGT